LPVNTLRAPRRSTRKRNSASHGDGGDRGDGDGDGRDSTGEIRFLKSGIFAFFSAIFTVAPIERRATFYACVTITVTIDSTVTDITNITVTIAPA